MAHFLNRLPFPPTDVVSIELRIGHHHNVVPGLTVVLGQHLAVLLSPPELYLVPVFHSAVIFEDEVVDHRPYPSADKEVRQVAGGAVSRLPQLIAMHAHSLLYSNQHAVGAVRATCRLRKPMVNRSEMPTRWRA